MYLWVVELSETWAAVRLPGGQPRTKDLVRLVLCHATFIPHILRSLHRVDFTFAQTDMASQCATAAVAVPNAVRLLAWSALLRSRAPSKRGIRPGVVWAFWRIGILRGWKKRR